jgi:5-methylcytosine-specific restriction endonuclease McrA
MEDEDVIKPSGIYEYLLDGQEKHLNIRVFTKKIIRATYEKQQGICPICNKHFKLNEMHADYINPWSKGGHTTQDNCQMLCRDCNLRKGAQ